jgi:isoleucyl-tRNA synthetase
MRREAGFDVMDRIQVQYGENKVLSGVFERNREAIAAEVLADGIKLESGKMDGYSKEWDVNGEAIVLAVKRI